MDKDKNKLKTILLCITFFCAAVMALSVVMIVKEVNDRQQEIYDFNSLSNLIIQETKTEEPEETTEQKNNNAEPEATKTPITLTRNLTPLFEKNADCIGWVHIKDTAVDYPVMHTPTEPQRYLHKNFDKKYSSSGVPFLKGACTLECDNIIIYGHNMKNGTMLSNVTKYRNKEYCTEHPVIEFETAQGLKCYTVFAVVYTKSNDGWCDFHTSADENEYNSKVAKIKERALYETGIIPEYGQQLLTLSTCYGATKSDRIIVIGVETTL